MASPFAELDPLAAPAPVPTRYGWAKAQMLGPAGIATFHVLFVDTPVGSFTFYFPEEAMRDLLARGQSSLTGLHVPDSGELDRFRNGLDRSSDG